MTEWIKCSDKLPPVEERVLVCVEVRWGDGNVRRYSTIAIYEDGNVYSEDSCISWDSDFHFLAGSKYDEEKDDYFVPEGWYEYMTEEHDEYTCSGIGYPVTHWRPLPELPKEGAR